MIRGKTVTLDGPVRSFSMTGCVWFFLFIFLLNLIEREEMPVDSCYVVSDLFQGRLR